MMDANELVNVAYDAMSGIDLTAHDRGQIYGVLQMALRTLEAQHAALLAEADEETAEAKKLWREALAELDALKVDRDAVQAANHALNVELRNFKVKFDDVVDDARKARIAWGDAKLERNEARNQCDDMAAELDAKQRELESVTNERNAAIVARDASGADYVALADSFATMRQERDELRSQIDEMTQRAVLESMPLHSHSEFEDLKKERDGWHFQAKELGQQCNELISDLRTMTADRDRLIKDVGDLNFQNSVHGKPLMLRQENERLRNNIETLVAECHDLRQERDKLSQQCDSMATEIDAKQRELDEVRSARNETITGLQAENARLHRSLEERMTAHIPGAVQVAKTEELHGMADVYAQSQRMQGNT